jgi:Flp pilus assembly protein TadG
MKRRPGVLADERGGTTVEFSLVMTTLFLLLFGVMELGWYLWTANALQQTAIQTARCVGILNTSCAPGRAYSASSTTAFAQQVAASYGVSLPSSGVTVSTAATCAGVANFSQVTLSYSFTTVVPSLVTGLSSVVMTSKACFPNQS